MRAFLHFVVSNIPAHLLGPVAPGVLFVVWAILGAFTYEASVGVAFNFALLIFGVAYSIVILATVPLDLIFFGVAWLALRRYERHRRLAAALVGGTIWTIPAAGLLILGSSGSSESSANGPSLIGVTVTFAASALAGLTVGGLLRFPAARGDARLRVEEATEFSDLGLDAGLPS